MKHIPNIITSVRLICAIVIAIMAVLAPDRGKEAFLGLFVSAAVSDMLDGIIARRFNWCTLFGARLDSISDLSLYLSVAVFLTVTYSSAMSTAAPVLWLGVLTQAVHMTFSYRKLKQFPAYHTFYSRVCAYMIFFSVLGFWFSHAAFAISLIAWLWISSCLEGMLITHVLQQPMSNIDSIKAAMASRNAVSEAVAG